MYKQLKEERRLLQSTTAQIADNLLYAPLLLSHKDSNLNWLNQNQMCYRYTMGQSLLLREK